MTRYVVTAGYVTVETELPGGGRALVDVARGSVLPADVPQEQVDTELRLGRIEPVRAAAAEASVSVGEVPAGMSVATTLEWVGGDRARARAALSAEKAKDTPRATAIARLEALLDG